jgi:ribosomal protein L11 methyltransferase
MQYYYILEVSKLEKVTNWPEIEHLALMEYKSTGVEDFSLEEVEVDEILGERSYSGADIPISVIEEVESTVQSASTATKKFYFKNEDELNLFSKYLLEELQIESASSKHEVQDWNTEWRKSYKPISILDELVIVPSWEKETYRSSIPKQIYIYPGMGFGTGNHETTFLCLELLLKSKSLKSGMTCMDFGCGSGILGLALRKYEAKCEIDLYDIEKEALDNCIQNIELNEISKESIRLMLPADREKFKKSYDIVFANILKNVLELELDVISSMVSTGGSLILSGLLNGQQDDIIELYTQQNPKLELIEVSIKGDWVAILFKQN